MGASLGIVHVVFYNVLYTWVAWVLATQVAHAVSVQEENYTILGLFNHFPLGPSVPGFKNPGHPIREQIPKNGTIDCIQPFHLMGGLGLSST